MDYKQLIPKDITDLPKYTVTGAFFYCTLAFLAIMLIISLIFVVFWAIRVKQGYYNIDYMIDFSIKREVHKNIQQYDNQQDEDEDQKYIANCRKYSRFQSRALEFFCLIVVVPINIGRYSCIYMEIVCFLLALIFFLIFNLVDVLEKKLPIRSKKELAQQKPAAFQRFLKVLWLIPLIVCFISFYAFGDGLKIQV